MYQQHNIRLLNQLRAPRVGVGALALSLIIAFLAGGLAVSYLPVNSPVAQAAAAPVAAAGPNVQDFGTPLVGHQAAAAPVAAAGPNVQDFGTPLVGRPAAAAPVAAADRSVQDFGTPLVGR